MIGEMSESERITPHADVVFEISWEVCNKVGGIYTVVTSKAARMVELYKDYFLIGPYFANNSPVQFREEVPDEKLRAAFEKAKEQGILAHCGRWMIEGTPRVILVDFENYKGRVNDVKRKLWDWYGIDSLRAGYDYNEPVAWSYAVGILLESIQEIYGQKKIVAHFHEWLAGAGLLVVKKNKIPLKTVFTTHATILGRTLASAHIDIYNVWDKIDPLKEAYHYGIESKYLIEKSCAHAADVFTTVSEITGMEAQHLLNKKPDVLLPNGLDIGKFPTFEEISIRHRRQRDRIREFIMSFFFPYYTFDLKKTLIFFSAARYEFHDKGIDIFIKALGNLNAQLKKNQSDITIVSFLWIPAAVRNIKVSVLENKTFFRDIKEALDDEQEYVEKNLMYSLIAKKEITKSVLFDDEFMLEFSTKMARFAKKGTPPLVTHDLSDENDIIISSLKQAGLHNSADDKVKVIYYPVYLTGADGLLDTSYYESMQGSHLGVFPSYYEPWGYTPLECGALGVPSVTTDLAGFGRYFCSGDCTQGKYAGIYVLKRLNHTDEDVVSQLTDVFMNFSSFNAEERIASKMEARSVASICDWKLFVKNYVKAHNLAIEKA